MRGEVLAAHVPPEAGGITMPSQDFKAYIGRIEKRPASQKAITMR